MKLIEYSVQDRVGVITLNRPEKRNALSYELVAELKEAFVLAENDNQVKVIILKAKGDAFCAGADLGYLQQLQKFSYDENLKDSSHLKELFLQMYTHSKVIVAQIQGHALAGGCGLATVCDFSFSVEEAKFGYTEVKIGFIPAIVMVFLIRKIGEGRAKELLLSGDLITANQAQKMGLINYVVSSTSLENEVGAFVKKLVETNSGESMKRTKQMMAQVQSKTLAEALEYASEMNAQARGTNDCKRGVNAFLAKEKLIW